MLALINVNHNKMKSKHILFLQFLSLFIVTVLSKNECIQRRIAGADTVCVCNATYCDDIAPPVPQSNGVAYVYESSKSGARFSQSFVNWSPTAANSTAAKKQKITVNATQTYQKIYGFGGSFTDSFGYMVNQLPENMRTTIINDYFSTNGLEYSMARVPIGGSDYSNRAYSYDDTSGDTNLTNWKLQEEDLTLKIPYIKLAQSVSPHKTLKLVGSPWSPPAWLKTNSKFNESGRIRGEIGGQYYQTWANYFVKFLDAYKSNNISIWGLTVENEPHEGQNSAYTFNCLYLDAPLERDFVKTHLGPTLDKAGYGLDVVKLMIYDDSASYMKQWADTVLADKEAAKWIAGIAFHWYGNSKTGEFPASALDDVHQSHLNHFLLSTEACHIEGVGNGRWDYGELYARDIIRDLNHWTTGWIDWNLALDMTGGPRWNSKKGFSSPVLIDPSVKEYYKQPLFYAMGHFSKFIKPDSVRVGVSVETKDDNLWVTAVKTPDNTMVLVAANLNTVAVELTIISESKSLVHVIPANAIQSYIWWNTS